MNGTGVTIVGTSQSGKTTFIGLSHLKLTELQINKEIKNYEVVIKKQDHNLYDISDLLSRGIPPAPTRPEKGVLPFEMKVTFRGVFKKKISITAIDVGGELIKKILEVLPKIQDIKSIHDSRFKEFGFDADAIEEIFCTILQSDVFLLIADGEKIKNREVPNRRREGFEPSQDVYLTNFLQNIKEFRKWSKIQPIKGVALIITKLDKVNGITDPSPEQLNEFAKINLRQTYSSFLSLKREKVKTNIFYSWLKPISVDEKQRATQFKVDEKRNTIVYPEKEYERIIKWLEITRK